jgi:ATP diphosphatase
MSGDALSGLRRLVAIMRRLRDPVAGCEWDIAQSFATIAPYTIEEAYEVADAIARQDLPALVDELGDLQLQVVFHATIAEQAGQFTLADVLAGICDKLERRHPHIFGDGPTPGWEELKAGERTALADSSALAGIPVGAPALMRAQKLQARAARIGFDWPDALGARDKVVEELAEVDAAASEDERRTKSATSSSPLSTWRESTASMRKTRCDRHPASSKRGFAGWRPPSPASHPSRWMSRKRFGCGPRPRSDQSD